MGVSALGLALALVALATIGVPVSHDLDPKTISHDEGRAYVAPLPRLAPKPLRVRQDTEDSPARSNAVLLEDGRPLGPAHAVHDDVRALGSGRFSHWRQEILFSASDGSDPRVNGRRYRLEAQAGLSNKALWIALVCLLVAAWTERQLLSPVAQRLTSVPGVPWFWQNVAPGLIVSVLVVVFIAGIGELYFRAITPFSNPSWPGQFDPAVGFVFEPGAEVRYTNHLDFWTKERANSLGFLDREQPQNPDPQRCHVVLIGDSYVEAAQVANSQKVQATLERLAR